MSGHVQKMLTNIITHICMLLERTLLHVFLCTQNIQGLGMSSWLWRWSCWLTGRSPTNEGTELLAALAQDQPPTVSQILARHSEKATSARNY